MTKQTLAIGDRTIIQNRGDGWDGLTGRIINERFVGSEVEFQVLFDHPEDTPFGSRVSWWTDAGGYIHPAPQAESLKASLTHDTSKEYADHARSRALPPWANKVLADAAAGEEVDVVTFRKAATQALSLAATRAGQSMGRRQWTREARHLIYWADAIIDNHIAGLPVYVGGPRSPKIHALEQEISHLKQAASDERRRLCTEIDNLKGDVRAYADNAGLQDERINALIREKSAAEVKVEDLEASLHEASEQIARADKRLEHLYTECNEFHAALEYAFSLLSSENQSRLAGFRDGYGTRVNDEH